MRSKIARFWAPTLLLVIGLAAGGCSQPAPAPEAESAQERVWTVGMSQSNLGEPWRVQMNADLRTAAEAHPEISLVFKDAQNDTLRQRSHIEEFLSQGVDLLIVSPKEPALRETIAKVYRAGIPVIVLDRDVGGEEYTQFIGADNYKIGQAAGNFIKEHLEGAGKVVELKGLMTTVPGQERHKGFRDAIADTTIEIIFEADMQWLEANARKEMESALARFPEIDLVYAHNDPGAHGAWLAARAAGREEAIAFVGIDALPQEGQAYVREGILDATFLYPTGGYEAIQSALKRLRGEELRKRITLNSIQYTPENIDSGGKVLQFRKTPPQPAQGVVTVRQGNVQSNEAAAQGGQRPLESDDDE